jgi:hypothetical protein
MKSKLKAENLGTTIIKPTDQLIEQPFNITFTWNKETIKIDLKKGNDLFKIAFLFSKFLNKNGIEHNITKE